MDFWGVVPVVGRGSLPFSLIHGEALVSSAALALRNAETAESTASTGIEVIDASVPWAEIRATGRGLVLHDPLCPLTPPDFITEVTAVASGGGIAVGVRPVTDTVKVADGEFLGETVDRESLVQVCSPLVLPASVVAELTQWPAGSFEDLVTDLRRRWPVVFVTAPALARRVDSPDAVRVLEALSRATAVGPNSGPQ